MNSRLRVLVADAISLDGLTPLRDDQRFELIVKPGLKGEELTEAISTADAVLVRSATRITRESLARADRLKAIGRAGVGVDTIDVDAATERGRTRRRPTKRGAGPCSSRRPRSAWASITPTCGSSCTPRPRGRSSRTTSRPDAPVATGRPRVACSCGPPRTPSPRPGCEGPPHRPASWKGGARSMRTSTGRHADRSRSHDISAVPQSRAGRVQPDPLDASTDAIG